MDIQTPEPYARFLEDRAQIGGFDGFAPIEVPDFLFDFQRVMVEWAIRKGRSALFADCGLGKTGMQLAWADNICRHTNGNALILTPLAVTAQTIREAEKFGIEARSAADGKLHRGINVVNYERLHLFDPADFAGVVCDESSILKSFDGIRRAQITQFMRKLRYRLLCTATPSPNEYPELGTSSEALGFLGYMDMLARFFKNDQGNSIKPHRSALRPQRNDQIVRDTAKWRLKGHAVEPFWRWVCSWAMAARKPSDLGFDDGPFILPPLVEAQYEIANDIPPEGFLFTLPAIGLAEQRAERRRTLEQRCERAAGLVNSSGEPGIVWGDLNDECDLCEKMIPDALQISGRDCDEAKEEKFLSFINGQSRVLVTKREIGAWGLNFQHCAHVVSFPTHSFERYYQSIRRCWRFGQTRPVRSDIVTTEGEKSVLVNLQRKARAADAMFADLVRHMHDATTIRRSVEFAIAEAVPSWLQS